MMYLNKALNAVLGLGKAILLGIGLAAALVAVSFLLSAPNYSASIVKVINAAGNSGGTGWATTTSAGRRVIVSNDHVCEVGVNGYVILEQPGGKKSIKRILTRNFERDLCVIEGLNIPSLDLADSTPSRFEALTVLGHPFLNPLTQSSGQYVADGIMEIGFNPEADGTCKGGELQAAEARRPPSFRAPFGVEPMNFFFGPVCILRMELSYTTVPIFPGNSGSPVTNSSGEVVGVMNSASSADNRGNFIPLTYVKEILAE